MFETENDGVTDHVIRDGSMAHWQVADNRMCRILGRGGDECFVGRFVVISFDSDCTVRRAPNLLPQPFSAAF